MKRLLCLISLLAFTAGAALADATSDVRTAMLAFAKLTSYHMSIESHGRSIEVDTIPPSKVHVVMTPFEMIKIDQTTWMKTNGTWQKLTMPGMDRVGMMYQGAVDSVAHPPSDLVVTDLGPKTVDGAPLHAYKITNKAGESPSTVYLDASGTFVRVESADGGVVRFSKFNARLTIAPPT